jgi:nitroreductase/NAD-dependent dihydropyrimidine dehydrogenase PreA subunit
MSFFNVNEQLCNKDGVCARLCPAGIIEKNPDTGYPYIAPQKEQFCIRCGQCISFCPHLACEVATVTGERLDTSLLPSVQSLDALLKSRRSIRMFKSELVPQADMQELLTAVGTAPTATNQRCISWLVVSGRDKMVESADMMADYLESVPAAEYYSSAVSKYRGGKDVLLRGASQLVVALCPPNWAFWKEDGSIALTYLEIAAHGRGIGMCWAGFFTMAAREYKPLRDYLGLTDENVCGAQMVGYPVLKVKKVLNREPVPTKFI